MSIFKSALNISFFTIISRIFGFLRDIAIAYKLGTGASSDVIFIALKIPNFFRRLFAEGAFSQAFVPLFSEILVTKGQRQALKFANQIFFYLIAALIILIIIFEIFMPYIMAAFAPGYLNVPEKYNQLVLLSRITFPYLLLISVATLINAVLNSFKIFIPGTILPIIYNLSLIISLFTLPLLVGSNNIAIAIGLIIGGFIQIYLIYTYSRRKGLSIKPQRQKNTKLAEKFCSRFFPAIFAAAIIQINSWIDVIIASLIPNAVSYIYYSERLLQLPLAIVGIALSTALLPTLSEYIKKDEKRKVNQILNKSLIISLYFALPAAIGFYILNSEIMRILFARGEFNDTSVMASSAMLKIYSLAVPAIILIKILLTNFHARGNTKTPMKIAFITMLINLILNLILIRFYSYLGIAIATVIASYCNVLMLSFILHKNKMVKLNKDFYKKIKKIILTSIIFASFVYLIDLFTTGYYKISFSHGLIALTFTIISSLIFYITITHMAGFNIKSMIKTK
jgi:putative peptidoglycan lipid II flippase